MKISKSVILAGGVGVLGVVGISTFAYFKGFKDGVDLSTNVLKSVANERSSTHNSRRRPYSPYSTYGSRRNISRSSEVTPKGYIFQKRVDAADILAKLDGMADKYDSVSVADYHDLIGESSSYMENGYGWTAETVKQAKVVSVEQGYTIELPPVEVL